MKLFQIRNKSSLNAKQKGKKITAVLPMPYYGFAYLSVQTPTNIFIKLQEYRSVVLATNTLGT
jgi:hypothetical protein